MISELLDPNNIYMWILIVGIIVFAIAIMSRPFSTYLKFVYPNAKFESIGNPFIKIKNIESIIDNKNIDSFKESVNTYRDYNLKGEKVYDIQKSLDENLLQNFVMMKNDSSKKMKDFFNIYFEKLDLHLIKTAIKHKISNREINDDIIEKTFNKNYRKLVIKIKDSKKDELANILKNFGISEKLVNSISEDKIDFLLIDSYVDKYFIDRLNNVKVPYRCDIGKKKFLKTFIDILNIKNLLRAKQNGYNIEDCKKLFIDNGNEIPEWKYIELSKIDSVSQIISALEGTSFFNVLKDNIEKYNNDKSTQIFETALDCLFIDLVSKISMKNYTNIGPTLRFLISKEFEIMNLKIISKGISERISKDIIKDLIVIEEA